MRTRVHAFFLGGTIALGTWQSICLVDPNGDNSTRQIRLSFVPG